MIYCETPIRLQCLCFLFSFVVFCSSNVVNLITFGVGFEVSGLPYLIFAPWHVWASRFRGCRAGLLHRGGFGLRCFRTAIRDFCTKAGLGFEVSKLPYETFVSWWVWASKFQGCLTRLLRRGASGLRGLGAALRFFCIEIECGARFH